MEAWWTNLTALNQTFFAIAIFFSSLFFWQLLAAPVGLGGGGGADSGDAALDDAGPEIDDGIQDASAAAFKLLSVRSIIAFGMLFGWAGALYLQSGTEVESALLYGPGLGRRRDGRRGLFLPRHSATERDRQPGPGDLCRHLGRSLHGHPRKRDRADPGNGKRCGRLCIRTHEERGGDPPQHPGSGAAGDRQDHP